MPGLVIRAAKPVFGNAIVFYGPAAGLLLRKINMAISITDTPMNLSGMRDLAVPTKFETTVNLRTAKALDVRFRLLTA